MEETLDEFEARQQQELSKMPVGTMIEFNGKWFVMVAEREVGLLTPQQHGRLMRGELSPDEIDAAKREYAEMIAAR